MVGRKAYAPPGYIPTMVPGRYSRRYIPTMVPGRYERYTPPRLYPGMRGIHHLGYTRVYSRVHLSHPGYTVGTPVTPWVYLSVTPLIHPGYNSVLHLSDTRVIPVSLLVLPSNTRFTVGYLLPDTRFTVGFIPPYLGESLRRSGPRGPF